MGSRRVGKRLNMPQMAEPQHRIGPKGVSSGLSIRDYPTSCIQQVKNICLHYVEKCSGKYENNVAAARYIHQMADEIISQLSGVAAQIKWHEQEPEVFRELLAEWNEYFPQTLGAIGTPRAVASKLAQQAQMIEDLQEALTFERNQSKSNVENVMMAVDAQLQASRNARISEKKYFDSLSAKKDSEFKEIMDEFRKESAEKLEHLIQNYETDIAKLQRLNAEIKAQYEQKIMQLNAECSEVNSRLQQQHTQRESVLAAEISRLQSQVVQLSQREKQLLDAQAQSMKVSHRNANEDDNTTITLLEDFSYLQSDHLAESSLECSSLGNVSDTEGRDFGKEEGKRFGGGSERRPRKSSQQYSGEEESKSNSGSPRQTTSSASNHSSRMGSDKKELSRLGLEASLVRKESPTKRHAHASKEVAATVVKYKQIVRALQLKLEESDLKFETIRSSNDQLRQENDYLRRKLGELEKFNNLMRSALEHNGPFDKDRVVQAQPFPLTHTPHFLDKRDTNGLLKSRKVLTGYTSDKNHF